MRNPLCPCHDHQQRRPHQQQHKESGPAMAPRRRLRRRAGRVPTAVGVRDDQRHVRTCVARNQAPVRLRHLVAVERLACRRVDAQDWLAVVRRKLVTILARHIVLSPTALFLAHCIIVLLPALPFSCKMSRISRVYMHDKVCRYPQ